MIVYLCGPINGCTDAEANDWRRYAKDRLDADTLDPMRRDYRGREYECVAEIVELDKRDVENSDIILVNAPRPSVGTSMEVFYAHQLSKPVVSVVPRDTPISPWMRYHSTVCLHSMRDATAWINARVNR